METVLIQCKKVLNMLSSFPLFTLQFGQLSNIIVKSPREIMVTITESTKNNNQQSKCWNTTDLIET